jgi:hypothetical protein
MTKCRIILLGLNSNPNYYFQLIRFLLSLWMGNTPELFRVLRRVLQHGILLFSLLQYYTLDANYHQ